MTRPIAKCEKCGAPTEGIPQSGGFSGTGSGHPQKTPLPPLFICEKCGHQSEGELPVEPERD